LCKNLAVHLHISTLDSSKLKICLHSSTIEILFLLTYLLSDLCSCECDCDDAVLAGSDTAAVSFTQRQIAAGQLLYLYNDDRSSYSSWLMWNGSGRHWTKQEDSFQLTITTVGADPLPHKSVTDQSVYIYTIPARSPTKAYDSSASFLSKVTFESDFRMNTFRCGMHTCASFYFLLFYWHLRARPG